jgi:uncharacterized membrane protein
MKHKAAEKHSRSLLKAISYRIISITADSIAAYFFTKDVLLSAGIVIFINSYSTILYYIHERIWANIHWGRKAPQQNP